MSPTNCRRNMSLSAATTGAIFLSQCRHNWSSSFLPKEANETAAKLSTDGLLETTLEARSSVIQLGKQKGNLVTYNGQIPGPRLESKPGDTVRIHFTNQLA